MENVGDIYVKSCQKIIPDTPLFGAVAIDDTFFFKDSETICNGENYKTAMAFVLCYGNITPRFLLGMPSEDRCMPYKGEITKSNGPLVYEINNISAYRYFEGIGIARNGILAENATAFLPFLIEPKKRTAVDNTPVMRSLESFTEDGTAVFYGNIEEGSTFTILLCDADDALSTARQKTEQINAMSDVNGVLLFSCINKRIISISDNPLIELEAVKDMIKSDIPFMMAYAGGEFSPVLSRDGASVVSKFHEFSLVVLVV